MLEVGLSQVFVAMPQLHAVLKLLSVAYLLFPLWKIAIAPLSGQAAGLGRPMTFLAVATFQWVNPKVWAMALTAINVYAPSQTMVRIAAIAVLSGVVSLPSVVAWAVIGQQMRRVLTNPARM